MSVVLYGAQGFFVQRVSYIIKLRIYSCVGDVEILFDPLDSVLAVVYFVRILKSKIVSPGSYPHTGVSMLAVVHEYLASDSYDYYLTNSHWPIIEEWLNVFPRSRDDEQLNMSAGGVV